MNDILCEAVMPVDMLIIGAFVSNAGFYATEEPPDLPRRM